MYLKFENNELVTKELNDFVDVVLIIIGMLIFTLTFFVGFYLFYTVFIEFELFLSKIAVYKYLKRNKHSIDFYAIGFSKEYIISDKITLNHWVYDDSYSVHSDKGTIAISWGNTPIDKWINKRILNILKSPEYSKYSDDAVIVNPKYFDNKRS